MSDASCCELPAAKPEFQSKMLECDMQRVPQYRDLVVLHYITLGLFRVA